MRHRFITCALSAILLISVHSVVHSGEVSPGLAPGIRGEREPKPSTGDTTRGETLYEASCVICHGSRAMGGVGPKLVGNPVLSNDREFWKIMHEGRHVMPPLKGMITDQQLNDIRAWIRTLP